MRPFETLFLRLADGEGEDAGVGVEALAQVLSGLQRCVYVLAAIAQGQPDFKPSAKFKRRYALRCMARAVEGDRLPLSIGPRQLELDLELGVSPNEVLARLLAVWEAIAEGDEAAVGAVVPEPEARQRLLNEIQRLLPKPREPWRVALVRRDEETILHAGHAARLADWIGPVGPRGAALMTVIAELVGVDFTAGSFSLRYAPTGRTIAGKYAPEHEVWLLKHRRKLIAVTGEFSLDADDYAHGLKRLIRFGEVDLAAVLLTHLEVEDQVFELVPALSIEPVLDEHQQRFELHEPALGLSVHAETREGLEHELKRAAGAIWVAVCRGEAPHLARAWQRRVRALEGSA
ncbi:MAG: hypothetical protein ACLGIN_08855 [Candidatus Sericytochromatia bacterium]